MPKPDPERLKLVGKIAEVDWVDSAAEHGWTNDVHEPTIARSVGYVLRDEGNGMALTESITLTADTAKYGCTLAIPRSAIVKVKYLRRK